VGHVVGYTLAALEFALKVAGRHPGTVCRIKCGPHAPHVGCDGVESGPAGGGKVGAVVEGPKELPAVTPDPNVAELVELYLGMPAGVKGLGAGMGAGMGVEDVGGAAALEFAPNGDVVRRGRGGRRGRRTNAGRGWG